MSAAWSRLVFSVLVALPAPVVLAANPIQAENVKAGTLQWTISNGATSGEIEGYASATSVAHRNNLTLFVNTAASGYSIQFFRMGWYGGDGAREMLDQGVRLPGAVQPPPYVDPSSGMVECAWNPSYTLAVPDSFVSGIYLAKLTAEGTGKQSYINFVVRDDSSTSTYLFQESVATYQAYNVWGGRSLYTPPAYQVSFNRPYNYLYSYLAGSVKSYGAGDFFTWDVDMLWWLEREGYDVTYCTDIDTHEDALLLPRHRAFLVVGHDEYWSFAMRQNVEQSLQLGVGLGFFGANDCYWQIRLEPSRSGQPDRVITCYKDTLRDPYYTAHKPALYPYVTVRWREYPVWRPEAALVGVQYFSHPGVYNNLIISDASSWLCMDTGLRNGEFLPGLCGWEVDRITFDSPRNISIVGSTPLPGQMYPAAMTIYRAPGANAFVFAAGSLIWTWGLMDYGVGDWRTSRSSLAAMQITRNALAGMVGYPPGPLAVPGTLSQQVVLSVYPSPFMAEASVRYTVLKGGGVDVSVFGSDGRRIRGLFAGHREPGNYSSSWDGRSDTGEQMPPGMYFVRVVAPTGSTSRRVPRLR